MSKQNKPQLPVDVQRAVDKISKNLYRYGFNVLSVTHDPIPAQPGRTYIVFRHKDCSESYMEELQTLALWVCQPQLTYTEIKAIIEKRLDYDPDVRALALTQLGQRINLSFKEALELLIDVDMPMDEMTFIKIWKKNKFVKAAMKNRS